MTFENIYFGYTGEGVTATELYLGVSPWWSLPILPAKVRVEDMEVDSRGFAVPWAMYVDEEHRFWLNGNYSVYPETSDKACMEVVRMADGYFVGVSGCLDRTWSPDGGYSDAFKHLTVLNLHPAQPLLSPDLEEYARRVLCRGLHGLVRVRQRRVLLPPRGPPHRKDEAREQLQSRWTGGTGLKARTTTTGLLRGITTRSSPHGR